MKKLEKISAVIALIAIVMNIAFIPLSGMGFSAIILGILFKVQHYLGADINLIFGLLVTVIVLVISLFKKASFKSKYYRPILIRVIIGGLGLFIVMIPSKAITNIQYRNYPQYIEAFDNYSKNPGDSIFKERLMIEDARVRLPKEEFEFYMQENHPSYQ